MPKHEAINNAKLMTNITQYNLYKNFYQYKIGFYTIKYLNYTTVI